MAAFAALAQNSPQTIENMVQWNTSTPDPLDVKVTFADGVVEIVDIDLTRGIDQARLSGDYVASGSEIWVHVLEQAVIQKLGGGVSGVCAGNAADIWDDLTGHAPLQYSTAGQTNAWAEARIRDALLAGKAVMLGTFQDAPHITGNHQFSVVRIDDGNNEIVLFDPALGDVLGQSIPSDPSSRLLPGLSLSQIGNNVSTIVVGEY